MYESIISAYETAEKEKKEEPKTVNIIDQKSNHGKYGLLLYINNF